ncbi:hypothetical protein CVT26_008403 [Gymnopilus dilepis]|uniref:Uncharacterized protein n=1 Tax=Gymnopilus dilepis TaxID=231916 RepID=A0A409WNV7_9AGAR|nr:hypothetical protein CVT26_008403 [Gymnopilus dilepis]
MLETLWRKLRRIQDSANGLRPKRDHPVEEEQSPMSRKADILGNKSDEEVDDSASEGPKEQSPEGDTAVPRPLRHFTVEDIVRELFFRFAPATTHSRSANPSPPNPRGSDGPYTQATPAPVIANVDSGNVSYTTMTNCGNNYSVNYSTLCFYLREPQ